MTDEDDSISGISVDHSTDSNADTSEVARQMTLLHRVLEQRLSTVWDGWRSFSESYNHILHGIYSSGDVALESLNHHQLQEFVDTIILPDKSWHFEPRTSDVYTIPRSVIDLMQQTSAAVVARRKDSREQSERKVEQVTRELEIMKSFLDIKEYLYEFPEPFVAVAVEIAGVCDGVPYIVQGKGIDGNWVRLFGQVYQRNEIGLHQFVNAVQFKTYRLVCMNGVSPGRPEMRLFKSSDDTRLFSKGIPVLKAKSEAQDGYIVTAFPQYSPFPAIPGGEVFAEDSAVALRRTSCCNVLDDNINSCFLSDEFPPSKSSWVQLKLPRPRIFNAVEIAAPGSGEAKLAPKEFRIEASSDADHWTRLLPSANSSDDTITTGPWTLGERRTFVFENRQEYLYYRLVVVSCHGSHFYWIGGTQYKLSISLLNFGNTARP